MSRHGGSDSRSYYDDFSVSYERERHGGYHALVDELEFEAVRSLAHGARVLEAGCGTGLILGRLAPVAREAWGLDLSSGMLSHARTRGLNVVRGSVTSVPFADSTFDLVCSFKVLAHVREISLAMKELSRVTRPGGHLALEFYNRMSVRYLAKRLAGPQPIGQGRTEADVYTRWDTPASIRALMPSDVELLDFRGVRVLTPVAAVHRVPVVRGLVRTLERAAVASPARCLGGFLIAIARKGRSRAP